MKLKKRLLAALLAAAMLLCSCSESSSDVTESSSSAHVTETTTTTAASSEKNETTTSAPETTTSSSAPDSSKTDSVPEGVPMWEGTAPDGSKITFLGSMHAAKDDFYPLPDKIAKPFNEAEVVAFECDTETAENEQAQFELQQQMALTDGTTLKEHLSPEAYKILGDLLAELDCTTELVDAYKPWAAYETITALWIMTSDITIKNGIDYYLMDKTKTDGKQLYELEKAADQINLVAELPEKTYDALFKISKDMNRQTYSDENEKMYKLWLTGNTAEMEKLSELPSDDEMKKAGLTDEEVKLVKDRNKRMLDDRNAVMVSGIKQLFKSGKKTLVCVGCAHYFGEKGIIAALEKEGYTFKRI